MAFSFHTNEDVRRELRDGVIPTKLPMLLGQFREKEHGHLFEYAERRWFSDEVQPDFPHIIYVGPTSGEETRLAKVLKTVAYVLTGEGEIEKWEIKNHHKYDTQWVR